MAPEHDAPEVRTTVQEIRPNPIIGQPATVEDCAADYAAAADVRATAAKQDARHR
ncbi:hypothetical protein [Streptomyces flavidovirens]|uniref:hypothetical protein n=1 Tax=Streptomyces flavidovirens TaxID=67298 RepID=UPI0004275F0C|nr:hypothetical protein [Streptomyces flavidovirens]